mmetsp:Transcript_39222/g.62096  ORF Transcript_39222/g.62096 Transcript_39222/m.62096 type:complete len:518 (-) Transcript_39222:58-1611(-)
MAGMFVKRVDVLVVWIAVGLLLDLCCDGEAKPSRQHGTSQHEPRHSRSHGTSRRVMRREGETSTAPDRDKALDRDDDLWRKPRTLPPIDYEYLKREVDALKAGRDENSIRMAAQIPGRSGPQPPLEKLCVPRCVGGNELVGNTDFQAQWKRGYEAASTKGIVFAGLIRNIGDSVGPLLDLFNVVGRAFARYHTFLIENNSKDSTKEHLRKECATRQTTCLELDIDAYSRKDQGQGNPSRVRHFTALRQVMLDTVKTFVTMSVAGVAAWHFLVMFDGDFLTEGSRGFHPSTMFALLGFQPNDPSRTGAKDQSSSPQIVAEAPWDVVCANQLANWPEPGRYRDMFAFRNTTWRAGVSMVFDRNTYFRGNRFEQVKSCFSGLAMYSMRTIMDTGCNYTYEDEFECEHVVFHKCLARAGHNKVAIYPPWAVRVNDHGVVTQSCARMGGPAIDVYEKDLPVYVERNRPPLPSRKSSKAARQGKKKGSAANARVRVSPVKTAARPSSAGTRRKAKPQTKVRRK